MAKKKKSTKPTGILPGSEYDNMRKDVAQQQLNIQTEINILLNKQSLTGERMTNADKKRTRYLEEELSLRNKTKNLLGKRNQLSKEELAINIDQLKFIEKISSGTATTVDLYKDYVKYTQEAADAKDKDVKASKSLLASTALYESRMQRVKDINKQYLDDLKSQLPILQKMQDMKKNPMLLTAASIGLMTPIIKDWNDQLQVVHNTFGTISTDLESTLSTQIAKFNTESMELNLSWKEIAGYVGPLSEKFGISVEQAVDMAGNAATFSKALGVSTETLIDLENIYVNIVGMTREQADLTLSQQKSWIETAGVIPQTVFRDIARSSEVVARYTDKTGMNMLNAATQANKLGISLSSIDKMSGSVLNFQQSIRDEFELSALLGKRIDLRQARVKFLQKDMAGGLAEVVKQLGNINPKDLDALTVEKLAATFGQSYEDFNKLIVNGGKLEDVETATTKKLKEQGETKLDAAEAYTEWNKAANTQMNIHRSLQDDVRLHWGKIEKAAQLYKGALLMASAAIGSMGVMALGLAGTIGGLAMSAWSYSAGMWSAKRAMSATTIPGSGYSGQWGSQPMKGHNAIPGQHLGKNFTSTVGGNYSNIGGGRGGGPGGFKMSKMGGGMKGGIAGIGTSLLVHGGRKMLDDPNSDLGRGLGVLGSAASWAGSGAMLGSMFGPAGTAIGAGIGGIIGAGKGLYSEGFFGGGGNQTQKNYKDFTINPSESDTIVGFDAGKHPLLQNVSNMVNKNLSNPVGGTASGGSNNINIDYDKMADAFYRGTMKGNKEYGVPNATDEKIWRGQDKASAAWGPK